ncbi:hypothetical protein MWU77_11880 [Rhodococcus sp. F64268]|uniref:hypothetical protein n=1 Tax=Rhodococcus sp. F64268 TaxID=2926402 RepID=UPI001FF0FBB7|nr:hypothetical protein [Rhodococcus sp. F64268]MCK0091480.1 hypothetical protein [Rhodococcus sp. F64268]
MNEDEFPRPPYSDDLLADLHAGALDDELADRLWPLVRQDHHAMAVIDRLDAVQARLREWGDEPAAEPIPHDVALRLDATLHSLGQRHGTRRLDRRVLAVAGIGAAAVLAVVFALVFRGIGAAEDAVGPPLASGTSLSQDDSPSGTNALTPASLREIVGSTGLGPLAEMNRLGDCLSANGFDPDSRILGSREIRVDDSDAIAILLAGPQSPQITALVVGTGCGATDPATIRVEVLG